MTKEEVVKDRLEKSAQSCSGCAALLGLSLGNDIQVIHMLNIACRNQEENREKLLASMQELENTPPV